MIFTISSHFVNEEDFGTDPVAYSVLLDDVELIEFGDDYHDRGHDKAQGFIVGFAMAKGVQVPYGIESLKVRYVDKVGYEI